MGKGVLGSRAELDARIRLLLLFNAREFRPARLKDVFERLRPKTWCAWVRTRGCAQKGALQRCEVQFLKYASRFEAYRLKYAS